MGGELLIIYIVGAGLGIWITYLIIKAAVVNGMKEVISKLEIKTDERNGYTSFTFKGSGKHTNGYFGSNTNKSEWELAIERQVYLEYSKKKLPIDYSENILNQKKAVQKIIDERVREKQWLSGSQPTTKI